MLAITQSSRAQTAVTGISFGGTTDTSDRTVGNLTYLNQNITVSRVETASGTFAVSGTTATSVFIRRNTGVGNSNQTIAYYQYSSYSGSNGTATVYGNSDSSPSTGEVMLSGNLAQGLFNPFANSSGSGGTNIERIDFFFNGGYTVGADDAIILFDLENYGDTGDGFRIAAYTSVGNVNGASNAPTAYANSGLLVNPGSMGAPLASGDGTNQRWVSSTTTNGDNLSNSQSLSVFDSNTGAYSWSDGVLTGVVVRFTDLGLTVGQKIYGYSLMAGDVATSSGSDLVNWNNSSVYLTNTSAADWGNVDFAGFGGTIARAVPEPTTYGALLIGCGLAFFAYRRQRAGSDTAP